MALTDPEKLLAKIVRVLKKAKVKYLITGGFAVSVWGRPRATFDIDIVIELIEPQVASLAKILREMFKKGYIDEEMAKKAIRFGGEFNFIDPLSGLKVDFWIGTTDEFTSLKFQRRKREIINGQQVFFISPEDLILSKLEWYKMGESQRQLEDIESIFEISGRKLDKKYLNLWAEKLGVVDVLEKVKA